MQPAVSYAVGEEPCSIAVADFNGDGRPDLAVVNRKSNNVSILVGNGDGTFPASARLCHCTGSHCPVAAADFDGDRTPDLVMSGWANLLRTPPIKPCVTRSFAFGVSANDLPNWRNDAVSRHPRQHPALAESQLRDLRDWVDSHTTSLPEIRAAESRLASTMVWTKECNGSGWSARRRFSPSSKRSAKMRRCPAS